MIKNKQSKSPWDVKSDSRLVGMNKLLPALHPTQSGDSTVDMMNSHLVTPSKPVSQVPSNSSTSRTKHTHKHNNESDEELNIHDTPNTAAGLPILEIVKRLEDEKTLSREDRIEFFETFSTSDETRQKTLVDALVEVEIGLNPRFSIRRLKAHIHQNPGGLPNGKSRTPMPARLNPLNPQLRREEAALFGGGHDTGHGHGAASIIAGVPENSQLASLICDAATWLPPLESGGVGGAGKTKRGSSKDSSANSSPTGTSVGKPRKLAPITGPGAGASTGGAVAGGANFMSTLRSCSEEQESGSNPAVQWVSSTKVPPSTGPIAAAAPLIGPLPKKSPDKLNPSPDRSKSNASTYAGQIGAQNQQPPAAVNVTVDTARSDDESAATAAKVDIKEAISQIVGEEPEYRNSFNICSKIEDRLIEFLHKYRNTKSRNKRTLGVIIGSGSCNPLTRMHMRRFYLAKKYLESRSDVFILGSLVSPSHGTVVRERYRAYPAERLPTPHRLALTQLLVGDSKWLSMDPWEATRKCSMDYLSVLEHCREAINNHSIQRAGAHGEMRTLRLADLNIKIYYLCKPSAVPMLSPHAMKQLNFSAVCVTRPPDSDYLRDSLGKRWNGILHVVDDEAILDASIDIISSRKVREKIRNHEPIAHIMGGLAEEYLLAHRIADKINGTALWTREEKRLPKMICQGPEGGVPHSHEMYKQHLLESIKEQHELQLRRKRPPSNIFPGAPTSLEPLIEGENNQERETEGGTVTGAGEAQDVRPHQAVVPMLPLPSSSAPHTPQHSQNGRNTTPRGKPARMTGDV